MTPPPVLAATPGETPAALLRRAAKRVRKLGAAATPGPWERALKTRTKSAIQAPTPDDAEFHQRGREHVAVCSVPHFDGRGGFVRARSGRDLDWIATLGPQVAEPLAAWLDYVVERMSVYDEEFESDGGSVTAALAVARAVLGASVPESDGEGT